RNRARTVEVERPRTRRGNFTSDRYLRSYRTSGFHPPRIAKTTSFGPFLVEFGGEVGYTLKTAGTTSTCHIALANRGNGDISSRRQGDLPESWSRDRRTNRRQDHPRHYLRLLSPSHRRQRHHRARSGEQRRRRRPAARHLGRGSRPAVRPAGRREDRQPSELEGALQGQLGQDAQRLDLRSSGRAEEPHVPRQVEEPFVPREADGRSPEVPHHLRGVGSDAGAGRLDRGPCGARARALFHGEGADRGARESREGRSAASGTGRPGTTRGTRIVRTGRQSTVNRRPRRVNPPRPFLCRCSTSSSLLR